MKSFGIRPRLAACIALVLLAVWFRPDASNPRASGTTKAQKIDALLESYNRYHQFNGSVLVAEHGKIILRKGYGMADLEWSIPNSPETKFRLGSVSEAVHSNLDREARRTRQADAGRQAGGLSSLLSQR